MTETNELTGRELAVACARAMGCRVSDEPEFEGLMACLVEEMLAWLHERGDNGGSVETATCSGHAVVLLCIAPDLVEPVATARGTNLTEALQRLVVAVAQRGSGGRA